MTDFRHALRAFRTTTLVTTVALVSLALGGRHGTQGRARELAGLWEAKLRFGPDIRGPLTIERAAGAWRAEIADVSAEARIVGDTLSFETPDSRGAFRGVVASGRQRIVGHWIQPATVANGTPYASPVTLGRFGNAERWRGEVDPLADEFTMYLKVEPDASGSMRAFLKNPERNIGRWTRIATLEREGDIVRVLAAPANGTKGPVLAEGVLRDGVLSVPLRGGTYDFRRVDANAASDFYPRSRPGVGAAYAYRAPMLLDDGWLVAAPEEVGLSRARLETFVRAIIDMPIDSVSSMEIHAVLIVRHGKLVLEEYFHGEHRDKPHDTRSAAKSLTATLLGAAIHAGVPLSAGSPVYQVMNGDRFPNGLEPRKRALTLEHLLTMSSGLDCDDADPRSPGHEDRVAEQTEEPDWWKLTLGLRMIRQPGERAVYCSVNPNLIGGVMQKAAGRPLPELFHELIAGPLGIRRYWMNLTPTGDAYMGGGVRFLPRDFMKLGQLMVNGGTWGGRRVVSEQWAKRATSPLVPLGRSRYGYLWWVMEYPYQGRTIQAFYAGGNGGQVVMGIPELDLVVAFYGGNYSDPVMFRVQQRLVPEYVLPAVAGR
ncbi:MAG TPA: serine hydrolase [Gemmatimonadales bacterium]|nr:serine hydrolase [Gemmatimonadales bacterium]